MRTVGPRLLFLLSAASLIGCGGEAGGSLSAPPDTAASTTSTSTVAQPTSAPSSTSSPDYGMPALVIREILDGPTTPTMVVFSLVSTEGSVEELWREETDLWATVVDVPPAVDRLLVRRLEAIGPTASDLGFVLAERDLASGVETVIARDDAWIDAEWMADGSGDVLVAREGILERIDRSGALVATLATRAADSVDETDWLQTATADGQAIVVVSGDPMFSVLPDGSPGPAVPSPPGWCRPVREVTSGLILASCFVEGTDFFHQLWSVPIGAGPPEQITRLPLPDGPDFGAWDLWQTADGAQYVQRVADCGGAWVERLLPDGTTGPTEAGGQVVGVRGSQLVMVVSGACDGSQAAVLVVDPVTGDTDTLVPAPDRTSPQPTGIDSFGVIAVPDA